MMGALRFDVVGGVSFTLYGAEGNVVVSRAKRTVDIVDLPICLLTGDMMVVELVMDEYNTTAWVCLTSNDVDIVGLPINNSFAALHTKPNVDLVSLGATTWKPQLKDVEGLLVRVLQMQLGDARHLVRHRQYQVQQEGGRVELGHQSALEWSQIQNMAKDNCRLRHMGIL